MKYCTSGNFFSETFFFFLLLIRGHRVAPHISYFLRRAPLVSSPRRFCLLYLSRRYLAMAQLLLLLFGVAACAWICQPLASGSLAPFTNGAELAGSARRRSSPSGRADRHRLSLHQLESMWHTSLGKEVRVESFGSTAEQRNALLQLMNGPRKTIEREGFLATKYYRCCITFYAMISSFSCSARMPSKYIPNWYQQPDSTVLTLQAVHT